MKFIASMLIGPTLVAANLGYLPGKHPFRLRLPTGLSESSVPPVFKQFVFQQRIDPKDPNRLFSQRYFINSDFADGKDSPVLYFIGGEVDGALIPALSATLFAFAKTFHAHVIELEHRYYGKSQPFPTLSVESMRYLTVENALYDFATFAKSMKLQGYNGKWIALGGSYSAMLAAWLRAAYPQAVDGAVASSAPVVPSIVQYDFDRYSAKIAGASCTQAVQSAFATLMPPFQNANLNQIAEIRKMFDGEDVSNEELRGVIASAPESMIQFGNRKLLCENVLGSYGPVQGLAQAVKTFLGKLEPSPDLTNEDPDYQASFKGLERRQWMYQVCSEIGQWGPPNPNRALSLMPLDETVDFESYRKVCSGVYGIHHLPRIGFLERLYQLLESQQTNHILFLLAGDDGWTSQSIAPENGNAFNGGITTYIMRHSGHCSDLNPHLSGDPESIRFAHEYEEATIAEWLGETFG